MILAGLQKTTLIDYPGKVACVVFVSGCNFRCPYCHNPELAQGRFPQSMAPDQLMAFLSERRTLLDGVVISGGEPTLCADLADLCRAIGRLGLAVKLDTNGSRPEILAQLIRDQLIDYVALDIKTDPARYGPPFGEAAGADKIGRSIRIVLDSAPAYEFRTTCVQPFIDDQAIEAIARAIAGASHYTLQTFRPTTLLDPDFWPHESPRGYSPAAMRRLQALAAPCVQRCWIR